MTRGLLILSLALLTSCGGGQAPSGDLAADVVVSSGTWVVLDIASGSVEPVDGTVDTAASTWRGSRMLFRQIPPGEAAIGRAIADLAAEADEHPQRRQTLPRVWIAANELTQQQWLALTGSRPWLTMLPVADPRPYLGDDLPAFGISPRLAENALTRPLRNGWLLDLPEADEWERACLAGGDSKFAWGDDFDGATAWAICDADRPQPVCARQANAWDLHDMHGNVWELVRDGLGWQVRGGAWDQPVVTARASNHLAVQADTRGWNVGLRPVLRR